MRVQIRLHGSHHGESRSLQQFKVHENKTTKQNITLTNGSSIITDEQHRDKSERQKEKRMRNT